MLVIRGLTRSGLEPFDFDLADGECVSVRGPSGGGFALTRWRPFGGTRWSPRPASSPA